MCASRACVYVFFLSLVVECPSVSEAVEWHTDISDSILSSERVRGDAETRRQSLTVNIQNALKEIQSNSKQRSISANSEQTVSTPSS